MKNTLTKKLSVFILIFIGMFSANANGQIVYTDVNPDVAKTCTYTGGNGGCGSIDSIDINNDGVFDLKLWLSVDRHNISFNLFRIGIVKAYPLNGSSIRINSSGYPLYLHLNDTIKPSGTWSTAAGQILLSKSASAGQSDSSGNWNVTTDGYLGVKIISGIQNIYCWVRLNVEVLIGPTTASFTYKDFSYNSTPNQPILAGATSGVLLSTNFVTNEITYLNNIQIAPNPFSNSTTISFSLTQSQKVSLKIFDMNGRLVATVADNFFTTGVNQCKWNAENMTAGFYILKIESAEFNKSEKLIITK